MTVIGVTGNTGSGKSVVCQILKQKGAYIIDADKVSRLVTAKGHLAYDEIVLSFGRDILDGQGEINRKSLGALVFNNREKLNLLQEITHKYILEYMKEEAEKIKTSESHKAIVFDAPLLIESGLDKSCDKIWVVDALYSVKVKRIMNRDNLSKESAERRLSKQTPPEKLKEYADEFILNNGSNEELLNLVSGLYEKTIGEMKD